MFIGPRLSYTLLRDRFSLRAAFYSTSSSHTRTRVASLTNFAMLANQQHDQKSNVLVFGAGNFGSCLADHLGDSSHIVYMWSRSENLVRHFNQNHRNIEALQDHVFAESITAIGPEFPSKELIKKMDVLLFAIPTEGIARETLTALKPSLQQGKLPLLIFVNKGIEIATRALTLEIIADTCGPEVAKVATFISGPSFAKEIVRRQPTSVSVASLSEVHANKASDLFHQPWFRCYTGGDPIGVELAGALKNVYAIAAGIAEGLGFENNTRAMLITRGLAEMTRIGTAYGASPLTFLTLAGVGDLFLTCSSSTSRNYTVGYRLGKGEKLDHIIQTLGSVAEGVTTTKGLKTIIDELGVTAPIATSVYEVLYEDKDVQTRAEQLLSLPPILCSGLSSSCATFQVQMVSPLWKACSEGDLEKVVELANEASPVDIEIKDHTGITPLIEAVRNGHTDVVAVLLDKGADPTNASSHGPPEQYTSDPAILELLSAARSKMTPTAVSSHESVYPQDSNVDAPTVDPATGYYGPPPGAFYYPAMPPMLPDGAVPYYVPPPPLPTEQNPSGLPNLPPPDVARMIPCRYYPACRYGASCMFAHPQTPYLQGPLPPPAQYPAPYDPMAPTPYPPHPYYPMSQPPFPTSPNGMPVNPMSPPPGSVPATHARSGSEVVSPMQVPFSPTGVPPPIPYGMVPPMSPTYGHPGQVPVPVTGIPPLSPLQSAGGGPQSPQQTMYPSIHAGAPGAMPPYAIPGQYPPQGMLLNGDVADTIGSPKSPTAHLQADGYGPGPMNREAMTHHRRGSARRTSFGGPGRKPPCLFFPSGRCRNGDECRFPHVLPDGPVNHHPPHFPARGGHRPRPPFHGNAVATLEEKMSVVTVQPEIPRNGVNGNASASDSSRSQSTEPGNKSRSQGFKPNNILIALDLRKDLPQSNSESLTLTNSQFLPATSLLCEPWQWPRCYLFWSDRCSGLASSSSPSQGQPKLPVATRLTRLQRRFKAELNGVAPVLQEQTITKLPVSFAAVATAAPDTAKEVSVSA
ncbi:Glycerol-3-phosphate dehydrogenase [NAD(P)+] [Grifola frondosa]|uniref:Glycerol-3-phosphate dehydrogenase [NAD(+)] n=1 Tax=Grifola frondosa TaxID=5627 RepID=A0A1C7MRJ3_GRIFR|nr:Glycerol-3-phosphate dehydrogenase [NAD(P)+] [Grifola frondosa]